MVILLKAGISFIKALGIVVSNMKKSHLKEILVQAKADIGNGIQISDAFTSSQIPFQKIYRASIVAGEKSGDLITVLEKFNVYLEKVYNLKKKTVSSLSYPIILFIFMIMIVMVVMIFVIPRFSGFYTNFEAELPFFTQFFLDSSNFLKNNVHIFFMFFAGLFFGVKGLEKFNKRIIIMDRLKLKIPFLGKIILENSMAVFSRTMTILIAGGITVPEATSIAIETVTNRYLYSKVQRIPEQIKAGNLLSDVLEEIDEIPKIMVEVIRVGDSSGNLIDVLGKNADFFESSINSKINTIISLIEPVIIIVLGLVILFMLLSIYLPIFSTIKVVR
jgi:type IV pilus assembly protein PilC